MTRPACLVLLATFAGATAAASQTRAPCSGTVRDLTGAPIAGARVVCSWQPDSTTHGTIDRREAVTDDDGAYSVDLFPGRAYCVWAIGPARQQRRRQVALPSFEAVGGRRLDLVCTTGFEPVKLEIRGSAPWMQLGPLSLRCYVARNCPVGPDVVFPGDGPVPLPPLPTDLITLGLVDGTGQLIASRPLDLAGPNEWTLPEPHAFEARAVDDAGKPVAGAELLLMSGSRYLLTEPIRDWNAPPHRRVVATTDARGHARGLVTRDSSMTILIASTGQASSKVTGWYREDVVEDGGNAREDNGEPLQFVLRRNPQRSVQVLGARADETFVVMLQTTHLFRAQNVAGVQPVRSTARRDTGSLFTTNALGDGHTYARLFVQDARTLPHRTIATSSARAAALPDIDLAALSKTTLQVVGPNGNPAPFAHVGISEGSDGFPISWGATLVTDANGRAELRHPQRELLIYATTPTAHGFAPAPKQGGEVRVRLDELETARFRILDADDQPIAGARLEFDRTPGIASGQSMLRLSCWGRGSLLTSLRSDADGYVTARMPAGFRGNATVAAFVAGEKRTRHVVRTDGVPIVLHIE